MNRDDVLITPHNAFNSQEALYRIEDTTLRNLEHKENPVNQIPGLFVPEFPITDEGYNCEGYGRHYRDRYMSVVECVGGLTGHRGY